MSMRTEKEKKKRKKRQRQVVEGKRSLFATGGSVEKKPKELTAEDKAIIDRALKSTGRGEYEEGTPMDKAQKKQKKQRKMGGGMIKKYSKGGKVDGLAIRGRTRGRMVKGRK